MFGRSSLPAVPQETLFDYGGSCWWCGEVADSREHKWKRSEIVRLFGTGNYGPSVIWGSDSGQKYVQGPNAKAFKFGKSLCSDCNNAVSQPFDLAYDTFSQYVVTNYHSILESRHIDLAEVFPADTGPQKLNLARYYAKHIGCRIAENAGRVPDDLVQFLNGSGDIARCVFSSFGVRLAWLQLRDCDGAVSVGLSLRESVSDYAPGERARLLSFKSGVGIGAIEILYDVNLDPSRANIGNGILPDQVVRLHDHDEDTYGQQIAF